MQDKPWTHALPLNSCSFYLSSKLVLRLDSCLTYSAGYMRDERHCRPEKDSRMTTATTNAVGGDGCQLAKNLCTILKASSLMKRSDVYACAMALIRLDCCRCVAYGFSYKGGYLSAKLPNLLLENSVACICIFSCYMRYSLSLSLSLASWEFKLFDSATGSCVTCKMRNPKRERRRVYIKLIRTSII